MPCCTNQSKVGEEPTGQEQQSECAACTIRCNMHGTSTTSTQRGSCPPANVVATGNLSAGTMLCQPTALFKHGTKSQTDLIVGPKCETSTVNGYLNARWLLSKGNALGCAAAMAHHVRRLYSSS